MQSHFGKGSESMELGVTIMPELQDTGNSGNTKTVFRFRTTYSKGSGSANLVEKSSGDSNGNFSAMTGSVEDSRDLSDSGDSLILVIHLALMIHLTLTICP